MLWEHDVVGSNPISSPNTWQGGMGGLQASFYTGGLAQLVERVHVKCCLVFYMASSLRKTTTVVQGGIKLVKQSIVGEKLMNDVGFKSNLVAIKKIKFDFLKKICYNIYVK